MNWKNVENSHANIEEDSIYAVSLSANNIRMSRVLIRLGRHVPKTVNKFGIEWQPKEYILLK